MAEWGIVSPLFTHRGAISWPHRFTISYAFASEAQGLGVSTVKLLHDGAIIEDHAGRCCYLSTQPEGLQVAIHPLQVLGLEG